MFSVSKPIFMKAVTPIHAGSGQDLGIVDMPIQRERHTNIPKIESSSFKGALKEKLRKNKSKNIDLLFGPEEGDKYAGALGFTDVRLLFFPVRSLNGIFKLVTCPYVLERLKEDLEIQFDDKKDELLKALDKVISESENLYSGECYGYDEKEEKMYIEEYSFTQEEKNMKRDLDKILDVCLESKYKDKVKIISNDDFIDFVTMYTEIITRNRIKPETGTASDTALFTEEYLPAESILYTLVLASDSYKEGNKDKASDILKMFFEEEIDVFQVGGNVTIGKGIVKVIKEGVNTNG